MTNYIDKHHILNHNDIKMHLIFNDFEWTYYKESLDDNVLQHIEDCILAVDGSCIKIDMDLIQMLKGFSEMIKLDDFLLTDIQRISKHFTNIQFDPNTFDALLELKKDNMCNTEFIMAYLKHATITIDIVDKLIANDSLSYNIFNMVKEPTEHYNILNCIILNGITEIPYHTSLNNNDCINLLIDNNCSESLAIYMYRNICNVCSRPSSYSDWFNLIDLILPYVDMNNVISYLKGDSYRWIDQHINKLAYMITNNNLADYLEFHGFFTSDKIINVVQFFEKYNGIMSIEHIAAIVYYMVQLVE